MVERRCRPRRSHVDRLLNPVTNRAEHPLFNDERARLIQHRHLEVPKDASNLGRHRPESSSHPRADSRSIGADRSNARRAPCPFSSGSDTRPDDEPSIARLDGKRHQTTADSTKTCWLQKRLSGDATEEP